jgi:uncharacterized protein (TIGR02145 family)
MNYWNGTTWVSVPLGTNGQVLTFCNGVPSWNGCFPSVITTPVSNITLNSIVTGGNVVSQGLSSVTERGVAYGTTTNPTTTNNTANNGSGTGLYTTNLTGLTPGTTYYVRAYAKNSVGTAYGNELGATTASPIPCGTFSLTDIDENPYNTVQIGNQCWTQSNLKVSKYRNGDSIPTGLSDSQWSSTTSGAYAIYNNDPVNDGFGFYGKLYNWYAVNDSRGLCPAGWHVPSDGEWNVLVKYLDPNADTTTVCSFCSSSSIAGGMMKSTAILFIPYTTYIDTPMGWFNSNNTSGGTNSSGFTGLPGGSRGYGGWFDTLGTSGFWWSSSDAGSGSAWTRTLLCYDANALRSSYNHRNGLSVRCVRD